MSGATGLLGGERIHRARSVDGTEIAGRVQGQGPPLVLLHGRLEDGDLCWRMLLPHLVDRFACYLPSTRGRGLSGDSVDHSPKRLLQDVVAFVESIGEPVGVFGESSGAALALGAAQTDAVTAVAAYEPTVTGVISEEDRATIGEMATAVGRSLERGRPVDGLWRLAEVLGNEQERAAMSHSDFPEAASRYVPVAMMEFQQASQSTGPAPTDAGELAKVDVPALVMHGARTAMRTWVSASARHVADHLPSARVHEIDGAGHFGPVLGNRHVADEITRFFEVASGPS